MVLTAMHALLATPYTMHTLTELVELDHVFMYFLLQVYFHLTVRREDDRVVETTRLLEDGVEGTGVPKAFVLGKGLRAPRGWELALSGPHWSQIVLSQKYSQSLSTCAYSCLMTCTTKSYLIPATKKSSLICCCTSNHQELSRWKSL